MKPIAITNIRLDMGAAGTMSLLLQYSECGKICQRPRLSTKEARDWSSAPVCCFRSRSYPRLYWHQTQKISADCVM